jgi:carbamoyltransferase
MILGLCFSHNATACIVHPENGQVVFCCSEEKFTRRKNEWGIPFRAIDHILKHVTPIGEISDVVIGEQCVAKYGSKAFAELMYLSNYERRDRYIQSKLKLLSLVMFDIVGRAVRPKSDFRQLVQEKLAEIGIGGLPVFIDHHEAHAASAFFCSPFDDALVVTLDGEGDRNSGSYWLGKNGSQLERLCIQSEIASVGKFYRSVTSALGFKVNRHEGKITGLAAYGDLSRFYELFQGLLWCEVDGNENFRIVSKLAEWHLKTFSLRSINPFRLAQFLSLILAADSWENLLNGMIRRRFREFYKGVLGLDMERLSFENMADIAAAAQQVLEDVVIESVRFFQRKVNTRNLVLAGGIFANVKLNQRLLEQLDTENIYIHPGMGDEGLAVGAAMKIVHWNKETRASGSPHEHVYLGPSYSERDIQEELSRFPFEWKKVSSEALIEIVAQALVEEEIVGLYRGKLEYGPRALGHRTILVNPIKKEINDKVNKRLRRTEFMPFAPVVLDECYGDIFSSPKLEAARLPARFMTITLDVNPEWIGKIQGVVHVDNTARPQIIKEEDDSVYYGIVRRFFEKTGIGCLVNTSYNIHEEPIVNTPRDALRAFSQGAVDMLVLEDYLVQSG